MKPTRFTFFRRVAAFCPGAALMLAPLVLIVATTTAAAQTEVFVPGNASGFFGTPVNIKVPLVAALTVSGPGTITVTYVSGTVNFGTGVEAGPNGVVFVAGSPQQLPLQEAVGISAKTSTKMAALIGVFVAQSRDQKAGFSAVDGTKNATPVGILPNGLFFIGTGKTFSVHHAGTLFLGIDDNGVSDNSGGFTVTVTGP